MKIDDLTSLCGAPLFYGTNQPSREGMRSRLKRILVSAESFDVDFYTEEGVGVEMIPQNTMRDE